MATDTTEARLQNAVTFYHENPTASIRNLAAVFNVPKSTLHARIHGRPSAKQQKESQQRLSPIEEASLVRTALLIAR